jgi:hypothetical protein
MVATVRFFLSAAMLAQRGNCPGKEVKAMSKTTVIKVGQSAVTGRFTTVKTAVQHPRTHIVRTIKRK